MRGPTRIFPALSTAYVLARRSGLLERRWFKRLYGRAYFAYKRHLEDPFEGLLRRRPELVSGGNVVDVGAHIGYTAGVFSKMIDPEFRVYAFEPDPSNAALLRENLKSRIDLGRVVVVEAAVGSASGTAELLRSPAHPGDHRIDTPAFAARQGRLPVTVPLLSLDEFFASRESEALAFVKLDVQGYELQVCRGMERTLARFPRTAVALEYSPSEMRAMNFDPDDLLTYFRERGYTLHVLLRRGVIEPWQVERVRSIVARRGYADLLCVK